MVLQLHEDLVWTDYSGRKVEYVGQTGGFGLDVTFQVPVSYNDVVQVPEVHEDCTYVESIVPMDVVSWPFVEPLGVVQEVSRIAVEDLWRRGTVEMLFEEVQSMSEHHEVDEVQGKSVKQNNI